MVFERNLAAIRKRHPQLADKLTSVSMDAIEAEVGPRGAQVFRQDGVRLGSAYDPAGEGRQIAETMASEPADLMIAVGFGLGEQFEPYLEQNPATLIIYEPSIARLRAGLERISVAKLMATYRDLYIVTDIESFTRVLSARYVPGLRARLFPHPAVLRLDGEAVKEVVAATRRVKDALDIQITTSIEMLMPWAWVMAQNGRRIASIPTLAPIHQAFLDKPAVIVAAGPSLDKQLPLLREMREKVFVIAIGQTLKALRSAGIEPDLVHLLESQDVSHQLTGAGETESLCTAYTPDCHPAVFDVPTRASFCSVMASSSMGRWIAEATEPEGKGYTIGGGTVAQGAVGIAIALGCNPISLVGQDLAFTEGRLYASQSAYDFVSVDLTGKDACHFTNNRQKESLLNKEVTEDLIDTSRPKEIVWVDAWSGEGKVPTWPGYASFIDQYRDLGEVLASKGIRLVNATEGGAHIPGLEHLSFREFLEETAGESFDARSTLIEAYDAFTPNQASDYRPALAEARKRLEQVERENAKGLRFTKKARARVPNLRSDQQRADLLRGLARLEKRVRRQLDRIPWLDAFVQPEIYNAMATFRRTERQDPTSEELLDESEFLFQATRNGVDRARRWFDGFEESFESEAAVDEGRRPSIASRTRPAPRPPSMSL